MKQERGLFIVFEGLDRCGKSTQVEKLTQYFSNELKQKVVKMNFPDRTTTLGGIISSYLKGTAELSDEVIHLLFCANRWEKKNQIRDLLNSGTNIICDRYAYSGVAFSSAKGLSIDWCKNADSGLPEPDLVIFLEAPINVLKTRGEFGNERYENIEFQTKVKLIFDQLIKEERMQIISADQTIDEVFQNIIDKVKKCLEIDKRDIRSLWNQK